MQIRSLLILLVSLMLSFGLFAQSAGDIGEVSSGDGTLNVRSGPSIEFPIRDVISNGDKVEVLENNGDWLRVKTSNIGSGWVYKPLVIFADKISDLSLGVGDTGYICNSRSDHTNVRYGPSSENYSVLTELENGHKVEIKDIVTNDGGYIYYEIIFTFKGDVEQGTGYIYHNAVKSRCDSTQTASSSGAYERTDGHCYVIAASRKSTDEVLQFIQTMDQSANNNFHETRAVYQSENGWYAISLGTVPANEFEDEWKRPFIAQYDWMPNDIYCSDGAKYVARIDETKLGKPTPVLSEPSNSGVAAVIAQLKVDNPQSSAEIDEAFEDFDGKRLSIKKSGLSNISSLSGLSNLNSLDLLSNKISDISALSALTNLTSLDISSNQISDISALSGLSNLNSLDLLSNKISDISALSGLSNLNSLDLLSNKISDISALGGLTNLTNLDLSLNEISDISVLSGLSDLTYLDLSSNEISDISALSGLSNLTELIISDNKISDITALSGLPNVTALYLSENLITDFSPLDSLGSISLVGATAEEQNLAIDSTVIAAFAQLKDDNPQSSEQIDEAFADFGGKRLEFYDAGLIDISALSGLSNLTNLTLVDNKISDISALSELSNLTNLTLDHNKISDISALSGLSNLTDLRLESNQISDISGLSALTNLTSLDISSNQISDISALRELTNLAELFFNGNEISDISALSELTSLGFLGLTGNQVSDFTPIEGLDARFRIGAKVESVKALLEADNPQSAEQIVAAFQNFDGRTLNISGSEILNISALGELTNLTELDLSSNQISDISALSGLTNLEVLHLESNMISDITALGGLSNLTSLDLISNEISDISVLSGLSNLTFLDLQSNEISDITALGGLSNSTYLNLSSNEISDISALSGVSNLLVLHLGYNNISDFSPIKDLDVDILTGATIAEQN